MDDTRDHHGAHPDCTEGHLPEALEQAVEDLAALPAAQQQDALEQLATAHPRHRDLILALHSLHSAAHAATAPPEFIGPYRILRLLGEGGMGSVYLAEQQLPVRRRVAVKVIKLGMDSRQVITRFESERQALALMQHSNIARVFDGGLFDDGRPYFVMEYVDGVPITDYCERRGSALSDRLELFRQVCAGVQHAHQKGVIHRDLKPSNILITLEDGVPRPKIIDFGLARATDGSLSGATVQTLEGQFLGTPAYVSPEQAGAVRPDLDTRTDVYSLGVVLYELLVGELPFRSEDLLALDLVEMQRVLREQDPQRPSTRVSTEMLARDDPRRSWIGSLRGDLDWIVMKALAKEPERRYQTPASLATDLGRYLAHQPVEARPTSLGYQLRRLTRRHRAAVLGIAATLVAILAGAGVAVHYAVLNAGLAKAAIAARSKAEENARLATASAAKAKRRAQELNEVADYLDSLVTEIDPTQMGELVVAELLESYELVLQGSGVPAATAQQRRADLRRELQDINRTELALRTLEHTIFDRAVAAIEGRFDPNTRNHYMLQLRLGHTFARYGLSQRAHDTYALIADSAIAPVVAGEVHLEARLKLGTMARIMGRAEEALEIHRAAVEDTKRLFEKSSESYRQTMRDVALTIGNAGHADEGEAMLRELIADAAGREVDGTDLTIQGTLGLLLCHTGRCDEAYEVLRAAHDEMQKLLADDDLNLLTMRAKLGREAVHTGRHEEARAILQKTTEAFRRTLGDAHWMTLDCISNLAQSLHAAGRYEEAAPLLRGAVVASRPEDGPSHGSLTHGLVRLLVQTELQLKNYAAGQSCAETAFEGALSEYGPGEERTIAYATLLQKTLRELYQITADEALQPRIREVDDLLKAWR
ncbi:MAG: serine/threonine-protein kinase [Planctomycetota bacterium]